MSSKVVLQVIRNGKEIEVKTDTVTMSELIAVSNKIDDMLLGLMDKAELPADNVKSRYEQLQDMKLIYRNNTKWIDK